MLKLNIPPMEYTQQKESIGESMERSKVMSVTTIDANTKQCNISTRRSNPASHAPNHSKDVDENDRGRLYQSYSASYRLNPIYS